MTYILDQCGVCSAGARAQPRFNPDAQNWVDSAPVPDQFVTATTIAEIERGVIAKSRKDPPQGEHLRRWFEDKVLPAFEGRVLSWTCPPPAFWQPTERPSASRTPTPLSPRSPRPQTWWS
ncbi:hypothetical protein [Mycobacterium riyadhense]|uniref:hypothetical protein n=1 Tax=Mycobacterium riyadhense TaxID=486698 RepID=UPI0019561704|nr:hypothetical protein [Mycobacterium riyadhense]